MPNLSADDHDLLVQLHENIKLNFAQVKADIKDLKDGTTVELEDHERRLKFLEIYKAAIVINSTLLWGAWGILTTVVIYHILHSK